MPTALHPRVRRRTAAVAVGALALVLASASTASAHVRVTPSATTAGGSSLLTFRVPTESDTASTSALTVDLPTGTPFTSVSAQQLAGWTSHVTTGPLPAPVDVAGATITTAALHVTWTADPGSAVPPGQFQQFVLSVGPLPAAGTSLVLPAHQTYDDGTVVDWTEVATPGQDEPAHPAPQLTTTAAPDPSAPASPTAPAQATAGSTVPPARGDDPLARWLGAVGLALGATALVVAVTSRTRRSIP